MSSSSSACVISRAALVGEALGDLGELLLDERHAPRLVAEDLAQLPDALDDVGVLRWISSDSSAVSCDRRRSRIALAWIVREREARRSELARARVSRSREARISSMTASRLSSAMSRPSRTCARRLLRGQLVLRAADDDLALVADVGVR